MSDPEAMLLRGVRVNNLKNLDVDLPLGRLIVCTGVSGSGKSSLVFDTLYTEAQRRYLQSFSARARQVLERFDKPDADRLENLPPAIAVSQRTVPRGLRSTVGSLTEIVDYLRLWFARAGTVHCVKCGQPVTAATAASVRAAVEQLLPGTRFSVGFPSRPDADSTPDDWVASLKEEGFVRVQIDGAVVRLDDAALPPIRDPQSVFVLVDRLEAGPAMAKRLTDSLETAFLRGLGRLGILAESEIFQFEQTMRCPRCDITYPSLEPRWLSFNDALGACPTCHGTGTADSKRGTLKKAVAKAINDTITACPDCGGSRLSELARAVRIGADNLADLCALPVADLRQRLANHAAAGGLLLQQALTRLDYLNAVDLGYLTLDRAATTLSSGEHRRVRLASALGSNLVGALYLFDEPTVGLHPRDTAKLLQVLRDLRDAGNSLVVVEHDDQVIRAADYVVDLGPGAGEEGGELIFAGSPAELCDREDSVTGNYLAGRHHIALPSKRRPLAQGKLKLTGATIHNLKNLTVEFPLGVLCVVAGISGAGKSALVEDTLYPALLRRKAQQPTPPGVGEVFGAGQVGEVVLMTQAPLARTGRSNPATYVKVFDDIRQLFADTSEARIRNYGPAAFSFNQPGGRCETCEGHGTLTVDMQFLADIAVICPDCQGTRFQRELLNVKVRSLNIAEVLNLTVREAFRFFRAQPAIEKKLKWLRDVGLDYVHLGQPADTLSGGECQRLKLAAHLASSRKPHCVFLLDEPTAGLHPADVAGLLDCLDSLVQAGHSLIVVEHNLDVIRCADHVIDLGPEAGAGGGEVVAVGTPEEVMAVEGSWTGRCLRIV